MPYTPLASSEYASRSLHYTVKKDRSAAKDSDEQRRFMDYARSLKVKSYALHSHRGYLLCLQSILDVPYTFKQKTALTLSFDIFSFWVNSITQRLQPASSIPRN